MSSIQVLTQSYFEVVSQSRKKDSLHLKMGGNVLVFFKMQGCGGCESLEPIFKQVAQNNHQITYAVMDTTYDRSIVSMSHSTSTPINEVPTLIFYSNGKPIAKVKGRTYQTLNDSISQTLSHVNSSQPQVQHSSSNMYGGNSQPGVVYQPATQIPSQANKPVHHLPQKFEEECTDEECLLVPPGTIPKNKPWTAELKH